MTIYQFRTRLDNGDFCMTPTATDMIQAIEIARTQRFLGAIIGAPGVGKTTVLERYAEEHSDAVYCVMNPRMKSLAAMLKRVAAVLCSYQGRSCAENAELVENALRWSDVRIVLIDEAQFLTEDGLDALRCIHDETGVPIVFAGNHGLRARVNAKSDSAFAQFASRIGVRRDVRGTRAKDVDAVASHAGVAEELALAWLRKRCTGVAGLRMAKQVLSAARKVAGKGEITLAHLKAAAAGLEGGA